MSLSYTDITWMIPAWYLQQSHWCNIHVILSTQLEHCMILTHQNVETLLNRPWDFCKVETRLYCGLRSLHVYVKTRPKCEKFCEERLHFRTNLTLRCYRMFISSFVWFVRLRVVNTKLARTPSQYSCQECRNNCGLYLFFASSYSALPLM